MIWFKPKRIKVTAEWTDKRRGVVRAHAATTKITHKTHIMVLPAVNGDEVRIKVEL